VTASVGVIAVHPASADTVTVSVSQADMAAVKALPATATAIPAVAQTPVEASVKTEVKAAVKLTKAQIQQEKAERAVKVAKKHLGDPYRWGATGPHAFDCSGLIQFAWRKAGVRLPRTTWDMLSAVKKRVSWNNLKPGDLIFLEGGGHVGIYIGHGKMINAPHTGTVVRIDKLNSYYRSSFVAAVRPGV
jgi:cell wall-associated NlpC family hydrolase